MRLVHSEDEMEAAFRMSRSEAGQFVRKRRHLYREVYREPPSYRGAGTRVINMGT